MNFFINEILQDVSDEKLFRILWIDDGNVITYIIELNNEKALPYKTTIKNLSEEILTGNLRKIKEDPFANIPYENIPERHIDLRNQAWNVIKDMVLDEPKIYDKKMRTIYTRQAMEQHGVSYPAIRKYLRKYWQRGKTMNALLPDYNNSGAKGKEREAGAKKRGRPSKYASVGINIDESTKKIFRIALEKYYLTTKKNRLTDAYNMMIKEFYAKDIYHDSGVEKVVIQDEEKLPSVRQFRYWYQKEYSVPEVIIARHGQKKFDKDSRAVLSTTLSEVFGPGSRYQIDATIGDIYLISKHNPNWIIGRPVIYLVMDVFSRMVVGMYIGLEGPSWLGAMMALVNTVTDKQKFCANYDIEISKNEWPSEYLPEILLADRGEFEGFNVERLVEAFNLHVENAAPYRADWKGVVEKHFDLVQKKVKPLLPGYVEKDFQERGARDYRLDAVLTLDDFTKIIIKQILYYNQKHYLKGYIRDEDLIRDDISPIPRELWNWGIINRTGKLKYFSEDIVKLHLLPRTAATVTHKGIGLKGIYYSCDRALKEAWFETARQKGTWKVMVAYDPRDMSITYWLNPTTNAFEECRMVEASKRYINSSLEEINYLIEYEKQMKYDSNHKVLQKDIDYLSEVEAIVKEAKLKQSKFEAKEISKAKKVGSIKEHRKVEREEIRKTEAFEIGDAKEQSETAIITNINGESMEGYSRPNVRAFLKRRKEKE
jgi:Mu transposase, C-terminal/Integrase core domain